MTTVPDVHHQLAEAAVDEANTMAISRGLVLAGYQPFYAVKRKGDTISLAYPEVFAVQRPHWWHGRDDEWTAAMEAVAVQAVKNACVRNADLIAGLFLGLARQGRDYFADYGT